MEKVLASGEVHPCKFILSNSLPTARKYNKEKCASILEDEDLLVKDLERNLNWEHDANDFLDGC